MRIAMMMAMDRQRLIGQDLGAVVETRVAEPLRAAQTVLDSFNRLGATLQSRVESNEYSIDQLTATDEDACAGMRFAYEHFRIVVEPGAAVGIAAVLNGGIDIRNQTVATIATGG